MKLFSAIHKRTHLSQEHDLKLLAEINYRYLPDEYPYDIPGESKSVFKSDFDPKVINVIPVSNPNVSSNAHRISKAQTVLQAAMQAPQIHNLKGVYRRFYLALGEEDIDNLIAPDAEAQPMSPMEDILAMTQGKPIKAFPGQDHKAHVEFKITWAEDPLVGGKSPTMRQLVPNVMANIREHQVLQMQEQVQGAVNEQAQQGGNLDPKVIAQIQAEAIKQVKTANEALASMLGGNDPMQMIAQAEMLKAQTEAKRVQHVKVKDLADLSLRAQELDIDRFLAQVKGKEVNMDASMNQFKSGLEAVKMGIENLMMEAEKSSMEEENKIKARGMVQKSVLEGASKMQQMKQKDNEHKLNLQHQAQSNAHKLALQKETNVEKLAMQRQANAQKLAMQRQQAKLKPKTKPKE
jgi:hypothetical protein